MSASTGLSTGAHLHLKIAAAKRFIRIKLPRGQVPKRTLLAGFEGERVRLGNMVTRGSPSRYKRATSAADLRAEILRGKE
jgi:hypothetical protein